MRCVLTFAERRFDPAQPRDSDGKWTDGPAGPVSDFLDYEDFERLYGPVVDDASGADVVVSVHENGDFVISVIDDHGRRAPIFDVLTPDKARSIADDLDWAATEEISDDAESDPETRLVDWRYTEDDIIVGYDPSGDVSLRFPKTDDAKPGILDDFEILDLSAADATDLVEALNDMADRAEELDQEAGRSQVSRMYTGDSGDTRQPAASSGPKGGQFALGGGRVGGKGRQPVKRPAKKAPAKPAGPMGFDGKNGTGYGVKGGDARVRTLQSVLNRFGLKDSKGQPLVVDGKFGPRTTAAVKKLQKAMGEEPTGKVTEDFIKKVAAAHGLADLRPPRQARRRVRRSELPPLETLDADELGGAFEDVPTDRHILDNGVCVTCSVRNTLTEHRLDNGVCVTCAEHRND